VILNFFHMHAIERSPLYIVSKHNNNIFAVAAMWLMSSYYDHLFSILFCFHVLDYAGYKSATERQYCRIVLYNNKSQFNGLLQWVTLLF